MRVSGWEQLLYSYLDAKKNEPFAWGTNDCLMFVAGAVEAITGTDYAADYRGTYNDKTGAAEVIAGITGSNDVVGVLDTIFDRIPVLGAMRGDIVARDGETMPAAGVCAGDGCYFVGDSGTFRFPLGMCKIAWRVK